MLPTGFYNKYGNAGATTETSGWVELTSEFRR